jgi:sugar phosphate permease
MMPTPALSTPTGATRAKLRRRLLPFVFLLYITSYLDRANVAFAKLPMSADLGFSEAVFGFGAGVFFLGYLLCGIPGAMLVERQSASRWIARMLIAWGCCTVFCGFVRTPMEFNVCRFALGCAEAGFFPGVIVYFSRWFVERERARAMAGFIIGIPVALSLGAPFSALILQLHWLGLAGWRWVFILQGAAPVILGIVTLFYLTDHPRQAKWLTGQEREQIAGELEDEARRKEAVETVTAWQALRMRAVLTLAVALCLANLGGYAFIFWLPTIIRNNSGLPVAMATACSALPFAMGLFSVRFSGRSSDRAGERRWHTAVPLLLMSGFLAMSAAPGQPFPLVLLWLCLTGAAGYAWPPPFWVLPTLSLTKSAAAASIGLINAIGNLGGFIGPAVVGRLLSRQYSYSVAIGFLAVNVLIAGILILTVPVARQK